MFRPGREAFDRLAEGGKRVPVFTEILADLETPTSAYWKLAHDREHSFLLESVTGGESLARYSFIGVSPRLVAASKGASFQSNGETRQIDDGRTPLDLLGELLNDRPYVRLEGLPRFTGGAVGFLAYDLVRFFERLPHDTTDDLGCDDLRMMICDDVVAFDHARNTIIVISHATDDDGSYEAACERISGMLRRLEAERPEMPETTGGTAGRYVSEWRSNMSRDAYEAAVRKTIDYIRAGDGVQMVISRRLSAPCSAHPVGVYRRLRSLNPSPYMYLLRFGDCDVIGASPEVLVSVEDRTARVRPIAGTRPRGETAEEDERLEKELLADEKERAEHVMLVDLGRNDIGRIARPGTVKVNDLMVVERYSHVMHIVSDVTGEMRDELDSFGVLRACFPAGTVSGAPKVRAMEIIEELEPTRRGLYAGAVGYFGFDGDMDMAIAIRTVLLKGGVAHVQAGAGIVYDSVPEREWLECGDKAQACIRAVELAGRSDT